jgi:hypothetical protein
MTSDELSKKLQQEEQRMLTLKSQMDNLYNEIQDAMPAAATSWIDKEVQRRIKDHPDIVQSLGVEKLRDLKAKINALKEKLTKLITAEFEDQSRWSHYVEGDKRNQQSREDEAHSNGAFRNVISNLGAILEQYNLINEPEGHYPSWKRVSEGRFRYAINPGISGQLDLRMREYNKLLEEYAASKGDIKATQKLLSEAKAKELWDQA